MMDAHARPSPRSAAHDVVGRRVAAGQLAKDDFTYTVVEVSRKGERRAEGRVRTHLREGSVKESRGRHIVECRIRELSRKGARLQLDRERPLPKTFLLREAGTESTYMATLIWQMGRDAGVRIARVETP